jgi:hypothetical protein
MLLPSSISSQGLCLVEIAADGHCLFSAIADQLKRRGSGILFVAFSCVLGCLKFTNTISRCC